MVSRVTCATSLFLSFFLLFFGGDRVHLQHYEDSDTFNAALGYFGVSIIHQTLTWTTGSFTHAYAVCFACVYTRGTLVYSLIRRTFIEPTQNLTLEKSQGGCKAEHTTVTHPCGDRARSCLTWAFESKCSCFTPRTRLFNQCCCCCCYSYSWIYFNGTVAL